mmetsp:Transcript_20111/g.40831  ORF Transcript_20111/g.40831 Transcript_20111/m.40831 type:complete len:335 (+) Transcript_20111:96-1100(+)
MSTDAGRAATVLAIANHSAFRRKQLHPRRARLAGTDAGPGESAGLPPGEPAAPPPEVPRTKRPCEADGRWCPPQEAPRGLRRRTDGLRAAHAAGAPRGDGAHERGVGGREAPGSPVGQASVRPQGPQEDACVQVVPQQRGMVVVEAIHSAMALRVQRLQPQPRLPGARDQHGPPSLGSQALGVAAVAGHGEVRHGLEGRVDVGVLRVAVLSTPSLVKDRSTPAALQASVDARGEDRRQHWQSLRQALAQMLEGNLVVDPAAARELRVVLENDVVPGGARRLLQGIAIQELPEVAASLGVLEEQPAGIGDLLVLDLHAGSGRQLREEVWQVLDEG